jgi:hypothetical protein
MQNTRTAGPMIACACTLILGLAGMAAGVATQWPVSAAEADAQAPAAQARAATVPGVKAVASGAVASSVKVAARQEPRGDAQPVAERLVAERTAAPQR